MCFSEAVQFIEISGNFELHNKLWLKGHFS